MSKPGRSRILSNIVIQRWHLLPSWGSFIEQMIYWWDVAWLLVISDFLTQPVSWQRSFKTGRWKMTRGSCFSCWALLTSRYALTHCHLDLVVGLLNTWQCLPPPILACSDLLRVAASPCFSPWAALSFPSVCHVLHNACVRAASSVPQTQKTA